MNTDFEWIRLYQGLAKMQQAYYFYMEPENSKIILNRSPYNHPHAQNGSQFFDCSELSSNFSQTGNRTNWMLETFTREFARVPLDSLKTTYPNTVSIVANLEIFPRNLDIDYLNSITETRFRLLAIHSDNQDPDPLLTLNIRFVSYDVHLFEFKIEFELLNQTKGVVLTINLKYPIKVVQSFSIHFVQMVFHYSSETSAEVELYIHQEDFQFDDRRKRGVVSPFSLESISHLILGNEEESLTVPLPVFLVRIFDVLIFEGGYFLTSDPTREDISMVTHDKLEILHCKGNRTPSRYTTHKKLDAAHQTILSKASECADVTFQAACSVQNCEICAESECLVCAPSYVLFSGSCTQVNSFTDSFDFMSRFAFSSFSSSVIEETSMSIGAQFTSPMSSQFDLIYTEIDFDFSKNSSSQTMLVKYSSYNGVKNCFSSSQNTLDSSLFGMVFSDMGKTKKYFYDLVPQFTSFTVESFANTDIKVMTITDLCDVNVHLLGGSLYQLYCLPKIVRFSPIAYFPYVDLSRDSMELPFVLTDYSDTSPDFSFVKKFPCKNSCQCSNQVNPLMCEEDTCFLNHTRQILSWNPRQIYCNPCPIECETCEHNKCLTCNSAVSIDSGFIPLSDGSDSSYKNCMLCHESCTQGCTGPDRLDCIVVDIPEPEPEPEPQPEPESVTCSEFCTDCNL
ncbi:MAG: hypothetical protein AAFO91_03605, partial [Bacteroidota bacterium]